MVFRDVAEDGTTRLSGGLYLPRYTEYDSGWIYVGNPGAPAFQNGATSYASTAAGGGHHAYPRYRRIGDIVYMEGLVAGFPATNYNVLFNLPVGFRPDGDIIPVGVGNGNTEAQGVRVLANGDVQNGTGVTGWASTVCQFPVAGGNYTWHVIGDPGEPAFGSGWTNYGGGWQSGRFTKIGDFVYMSGLVTRSTTATTTIFTLPTGYINTNGNTHTPVACTSSLGGADFGVNISAAVVARGTGTGGYLSLAGIKLFVGTNDAKWRQFRGGADGFYESVASGAYGGGWPVPKVRRDGKIIFLEGLSNVPTASTVFAKLPHGYAPGQQLIVPVVNSSNRRWDVRGPNDGDVTDGPNALIPSATGVNGLTNSWVVAEDFEGDIRWNS